MSTATLPKKIELAVGDHKKAVLDARFRCDKCGAQAYVRTTLNSGLPLFWCGHHAHEYEAELRPQCKEWYSETNRLVEDRKKGSEN
jgi:transcription elongation factor Elf1